MEQHVRDAYDATRDFSRKAFRSACYAPFASLYFTPLGEVKLCCKSPYVLGNIATERLDDIWNGKRLRGMREALRNYRFQAGCQFCEWQIDSGRYHGSHTMVFEDLTVDEAEVTWPRQLEFVISNLCNYECIMCYGELSSRIRANRDRLPPLPMVYGDQFFEDLRKYLPHLETAKWHGGEPFLAPENYRTWDMMIADGMRPGFRAAVTTNASTYNAKVERVLAELPFDITVSIDGITQETLETVRIGSKHAQVMANVERFREYAAGRGTRVTFAICLMRQNWHEFADILRYADQRDIQVFINTVIEPENCSLFTLPLDEQRRILVQLEAAGESLSKELKINYPVFLDGVQSLRGNIAAAAAAAKDVPSVRKSWQAPVDHIAEAWQQIGAGAYAQAADTARKIAATDSRYYFARVVLAHALLRVKDLAGADQVLDEALQLTKRRSEAYVERAWLRLAQNRCIEGVADAVEARKLAMTTDAQFAAASAFAYLSGMAGDYVSSKATFDELIDLRPADPKPRIHRGWLQRHAGKLAEARLDAEEAVRLAPNDSEARTLLLSLRE
jgi:MoaA/NifB/PqqE/SkfB family radical SAM enzyme/Flp pilus assembly protein TadD